MSEFEQEAELEGPVSGSRRGKRGATKTGPDNEYPIKNVCRCERPTLSRDLYDDVRCIDCGHERPE